MMALPSGRRSEKLRSTSNSQNSRKEVRTERREAQTDCGQDRPLITAARGGLLLLLHLRSGLRSIYCIQLRQGWP